MTGAKPMNETQALGCFVAVGCHVLAVVLVLSVFGWRHGIALLVALALFRIAHVILDNNTSS